MAEGEDPKGPAKGPEEQPKGSRKGHSKGSAKGRAKGSRAQIKKVYVCPWDLNEFVDAAELQGHILGAHTRKTAAEPAEDGGDTPSKEGGEEPKTITDERGSLREYIMECWPSEKKIGGVLRRMELNGWDNLQALNEALVFAGCPVGETKLILTNWRERLLRAGKKVGDIPEVVAPEGRPVEELSEEDVEREYRRADLEEMRELRRERARERLKGGGKPDALAEEIRLLKASLEKKDQEDRHAREITDLKRELTERSTPATNTFKRRIIATNPQTGEPLTDGEGKPLYNFIEEPWTPPERTQQAPADQTTVIRETIRAMTEGRPKEDNSQVKALQDQVTQMQQLLQNKAIEDGMRAAVGQVAGQIDAISKQVTAIQEQRTIEDRIAAVLKERGVGTTPNAERELDTTVMKEGFGLVKEELKNVNARIGRVTEMVQPLAAKLGQAVGTVVEKDLAGSPAEPRQPSEADLRAGEAASAPSDLPPTVPPSSPAPEIPPERPRPRVKELGG